VDQKVLREPLLYLSLYLKTYRADYYRLLQEVRQRGTWEAWLEFFLEGVAQTANNAHDSALRIVTLFRADRDRLTIAGDRTNSTLRIHDLLQTYPFVNAAQIVQRTGLSMPTVNSSLVVLQREGIIHELTGKRRGRAYAYTAFLRILDEGTDAVPWMRCWHLE
jgi:Fic family protein